MKVKLNPVWALFLITGSLLICLSFKSNPPIESLAYSFPYKKAGLTERQAAAQLLSRLTYGATPGQVDEVVKMGLERWFKQQLDAQLPDDSLDQRLSKYDALKLTNSEVVGTYLRSGEVVKMAVRDGYFEKDSIGNSDKNTYRKMVQSYMLEKGFKPQQELFKQLISEKILTAVYSHNQLQQVLTDFWFNHFNVSITKNSCAPFIMAYERDVIRPNASGKFGDLLLATAKSPAMLYFLDNFSSTLESKAEANESGDSADSSKAVNKIKKVKKRSGLNENYAREVMELHTLGVDGGYTQQDVTEAARVLTGWTVYPMNGNKSGKQLTQPTQKDGQERRELQGFVHEGDFQFVPNRHDKGPKKVLNVTFAAGGGYEEGVKLMNMLAHHPSTAKFITYKLALRFVSDNPSKSLLDKMAKTFLDKDGDIKAVLITMVSSPEFWSPKSVRAKIKSPFELAISAVRSLDGDVEQPYQLYNWVTKMGQKIYYYQAPPGFPDKAQYWINTGALLSRMNFGLALSSQRIPGVNIDLIALNGQHEPESSRQALATYSALMMPERNLSETIKRLSPLLNDPELISKVDAADTQAPGDMKLDTRPGVNGMTSTGNKAMLAKVVGMVIGSPEFQRR